tara:strand:+ start:77348 stop:77629 length:282 start_codon:yes stop_codon:yes gene_type:complete
LPTYEVSGLLKSIKAGGNRCDIDKQQIQPCLSTLPEHGLDAKSIQVIAEVDVLYREMCSAMKLAENQILLESYIFALDPIGKQFIAILNKIAA